MDKVPGLDMVLEGSVRRSVIFGRSSLLRVLFGPESLTGSSIHFYSSPSNSNQETTPDSNSWTEGV